MTVKIIRSPTISAVSTGTDVILVDYDSGDCLALNETASAIWDALDAPTTIDAISLALTQRFTVERSEALSAVTHAIGDLRARGLVRTLD